MAGDTLDLLKRVALFFLLSEPEMRNLIFYALVLLLIGTVWLDNRHPFLPDKLYCILGAGYETVYRLDASELPGGSWGKVGASPRPFVSAIKVCVHGSLWDGIETAVRFG
jgi:hypothetical protein